MNAKKRDVNPEAVYSIAVIKRYAKSFNFAAKLFPKEKRVAANAIYAFCRYADNIIDSPRERSKRERLAELRSLAKEIKTAYKSGESLHPAVKPFIEVAKKYNIPKDLPLALVDGVKMDTEKTRYKKFKDLYVFCYKVASVVGLMMTRPLGFSDEKALFHAEKLGVAMQLTNILRDVKEDKDMGRIYIPIEDLKRFNLSERDVLNENFDENFAELMKFEIDRAEYYYDLGEQGIKYLDKDSRFAIAAASKIYKGILRKLAAADYNPFAGRVFVPKAEKAAILSGIFIKNKFFN